MISFQLQIWVMKLPILWLSINKVFCCCVFISSWEGLKIPHLCSVSESCWSPAYNSQLPDPPLTSPTETDPGGSQGGCPTHRTLTTTRLCFSSNGYMRKMLLKVQKKFNMWSPPHLNGQTRHHRWMLQPARYEKYMVRAALITYLLSTAAFQAITTHILRQPGMCPNH